MDYRKLSVFAANPEDTQRVRQEEKHKYRDEFQRDRDRILYSKSFRRLSGKTQIFVTDFGDHVRTRLTHTLEVMQIATTIARVLNLNVMLTEAIAYGHDIGHTPFGHAGERTLNLIMNGCIKCFGYNDNLNEGDKGFKHNLQGIRIAHKLDFGYDGERGLNLTKYTLWGIKNHTGSRYKKCDYCRDEDSIYGFCSYQNASHRCSGTSLGFYDGDLVDKEGVFLLDDRRDWTVEGIIVAIADELAQRHHDIEDGVYAKLIDLKALNKFLKGLDGFLTVYDRDNLEKIIYHDGRSSQIRQISKLIVNFYVTSYIENIADVLEKLRKKYKIKTHKDFCSNKGQIYDDLTDFQKNDISKAFEIGGQFGECDKKLRDFVSVRVVQSEIAQQMDGKAAYIIVKLVKAYMTNPQQLPDLTIMAIVKTLGTCFSKEDQISEIAIIGAARQKLKDLCKENKAQFQSVILRTICDYISGMTDMYAMQQYQKLYAVRGRI